MDNYRFKELEIKDLESLSGLSETLSHLQPSGDLTGEQAIAQLKMMNQRDIHVFVAVSGDKIVGAVSVCIEPKLIRGGVLSSRIEDLVTHPAHQGKGIASELITSALQYSKDRRCYKVTLTCKDRLVGFYQKFGLKKHSEAMKLYLESH